MLTLLSELRLQNNRLTNVASLERLTRLEYLYIWNNPALTKSQIAKLQTALPKCAIDHNAKLSNEASAKVIEAAIRRAAKKPEGELTKADLEKVTSLNFFKIPLSNLKGLEKLPKLEFLRLDGNQLTEVKGLENLTQLTHLVLGSNQLTEVNGIGKLKKLEKLYLSYNQLTEVKGLKNLTRLSELYLFNNQLTDVKGLEKLTKLEKLWLSNNPDLTKAQIDALQKALPKCSISHDFQ